MYFFTIEAFEPYLERMLPGIMCDDLFKITFISDVYDFDIQAQGDAQDAISELLTDEELEDLAIDYHEDFFPYSLCFEEVEEEPNESIEDGSDLSDDQLILDPDEYQIAFDGLPHIERELTIQDYIMCSYTLGCNVMEALQMRINVIVTPDTAESIDFQTNTTVH